MISVSLLLLSFFAGVLTVLAPCVLPVLPVIISGAAAGQQRWRPWVITGSLAVSIVLFTLLLKVSTLFIDIPQSFWKFFSATVIGLFGVSLVWPDVWSRVAVRIGIEDASHGLLHKADKQSGLGGAVALGAALGPVFSSCSPTYFLILATILPASFSAGVVYLAVYAIGLFAILLPIAYAGQGLLRRLRFAANPYGAFRRGLGVLLLVVAVAIASGLDKRVEEYLLRSGLNITNLEQRLLDKAVPADMAATSSVQQTSGAAGADALPVLGAAPELAGLGQWINSAGIASMEELRGKVVLVDFWTYSCINCIRTLPYLQAWHDTYADQGLVIIGVHAPEFQFEKKYDNVLAAVQQYGITYPVVQDNDFALWRAYSNRYWPAKYLIDQEGNVRYRHFGEGNYQETEDAIRSLLQVRDEDAASVDAASVDHGQIATPEIYLGTARRKQLATGEAPLQKNQWRLGGAYTEDEERVVLGVGGGVALRFGASQANMVLGGTGTARVLIDGKPASMGAAGSDVVDGLLQVDGERLYQVADFAGVYGEHTVEVVVESGSVEAYTFTFG